jgi:hypothetical protein
MVFKNAEGHDDDAGELDGEPDVMRDMGTACPMTGEWTGVTALCGVCRTGVVGAGFDDGEAVRSSDNGVRDDGGARDGVNDGSDDEGDNVRCDAVASDDVI